MSKAPSSSSSIKQQKDEKREERDPSWASEYSQERRGEERKEEGIQTHRVPNRHSVASHLSLLQFYSLVEARKINNYKI